jgi:hypothetical protein
MGRARRGCTRSEGCCTVLRLGPLDGTLSESLSKYSLRPSADAKPLQQSKPEPDIRHPGPPAPLDSSKAGPGMVSWSGAGGEGNFLPVHTRTLVSCLPLSSVHSASVSERGSWSRRGGGAWLCILSRKDALAESVRGGE